MALGLLAFLFLLGLPFAAPAFAAAAPHRGVAAGAHVFAVSGCTHCHGENLAGTDIGPNLQGAGRHLKPAQIRKQIEDGGLNMPAFGNVLAHDQISDLVEYLRTQRSRTAPSPALTKR